MSLALTSANKLRGVDDVHLDTRIFIYKAYAGSVMSED